MVLWIVLFFFALVIVLRIAYIVLRFSLFNASRFSLCLAGEDCRADAEDGCALFDGDFVV